MAGIYYGCWFPAHTRRITKLEMLCAVTLQGPISHIMMSDRYVQTSASNAISLYAEPGWVTCNACVCPADLPRIIRTGLNQHHLYTRSFSNNRSLQLGVLGYLYKHEPILITTWSTIASSFQVYITPESSIKNTHSIKGLLKVYILHPFKSAYRPPGLLYSLQLCQAKPT